MSETPVFDQKRPSWAAEIKVLSENTFAFWELLAFFAFALGILASALFAHLDKPDGPPKFALLSVIACAAWMAGSLLGFLFGVPRFKSDSGMRRTASTSEAAQSAANFTPNTNLEQISDWLTKIIVGATLVQIGPIAHRFVEMCSWIGQRINEPSADIFVGGLILFLFFSGLLWGYLWCSIRIFREMLSLVRKLEVATGA